MARTRVLNWNGEDLPSELRELPAGRYSVQPACEPPALSPEEEAGIEAALASHLFVQALKLCEKAGLEARARCAPEHIAQSLPPSPHAPPSVCGLASSSTRSYAAESDLGGPNRGGPHSSAP